MDVARAPRPSLLWAPALAGVAAAGLAPPCSDERCCQRRDWRTPVLALLSPGSPSPTYCADRAVAPPASRFGPLTIAAGFASFRRTLPDHQRRPFTVGHALDLLPPVLFLHVFRPIRAAGCEVYPRWSDRDGVLDRDRASTRRDGIGRLRPHNLLEIASDPWAGLTAMRLQLARSACLRLCGVGILAARRLRAGLRRSLALLIDAFALGLVMIAFLLLRSHSAVLSGFSQTIRWATFVMLGLAPLALLDRAPACPSRPLVRRRALPRATGGSGAGDLRVALARALRDPSLTLVLAARVRELRGSRRPPVELPIPDGERAMTVIDRDGEPRAALLHDRALSRSRSSSRPDGRSRHRSRERAASCRASCSARRAARARATDRRGGQKERQRLERNLHDGAQHRLVALSLELSLLEERLNGDSRRGGSRAGEARSRRRWRSCEIARAGSIRRRERARAGGRAGATGRARTCSRAPQGRDRGAPTRGSRGRRVLPRLERSRTSASTLKRHWPRSKWHGQRADPGRDGRRRDRRRRYRARIGLRGLADRVEALGGRLRVWSPDGRRHPGKGGDSVRAVIAEDGVLLREGLAAARRRRLRRRRHCQTRRAPPEGPQLFPDVAIVDIRLPPTHNDEGLRAALEIRANHPSVGVLVLSQYLELGLAMKLLAESAEGAGYLLKDRDQRRQGVRRRGATRRRRRLGDRPDHRLDAALRSGEATIRSRR